MNSTTALKESVLERPEWFPANIEFAGDVTITFWRVSRDILAESAFLDHRMIGGPMEQRRVSFPRDEIRSIVTGLENTTTSPRFILHTAFCGSTLMARLIDHAGVNLSLKEPQILNVLAHEKRYGAGARANADASVFRDVVRLVLLLLARSFEAGETVTIKPSNLANNLIDDYLDVSGATLVMHSSAARFLRSMMARGEEGRVFLRTIFAYGLADGGTLSKLPHAELLKLTDLQAGLLGWAQQFEFLRKAFSANGSAPARSLSVESFLADKHAALKAALRLAAPSLDTVETTRLAEKGDFTRDSKSGESFGAESAIDENGRNAITGVLNWIQSARLFPEIGAPLPNPLVPDGGNLAA